MDYKERYEKWLNDEFFVFDMATRKELAELTDEKEIEDRFYCDLVYGIGDLRGVMGAGTNYTNNYIMGNSNETWIEITEVKDR